MLPNAPLKLILYLLPLTLLHCIPFTSAAVNCPKPCKCSWVLDSLGVDCSNQGLNTYPNLAGLQIDHLDLSGNQFTEFPVQLAEIESLIQLDLSNNKIDYLDNDALLGFTSLRILLLANNSFTSWHDLNPAKAFRNAISLRQLTLSYNQLGSFTDHERTFILQSESLTDLELAHCDITMVGGQNVFAGLPALERLVLSGNALITLDDLPSNSLRVLELSDCQLPRISPTLIDNLPSLESLNISWNFALHFNDDIVSHTLLELDVSFCNLDVINLAGFPALARARLRGNMLRTLDANTFANNTQLQLLDLARNALRRVQDDTFRKLRRLTTLDLSYNEIAQLDRNLFRTNEVLVSLNLSRNVIERFTKLISNSLREISLSGCEIIVIDSDALTGLSALQRLVLSKTLIKQFPAGMHSETLQKLDLSNCKLTAINNMTFQGFPELASLHLNGNRFTNPIPTNYFRLNKYLDAVWVGDNPWICNCYDPAFMDFYDWLIVKPKKLRDQYNLRCASPAFYYGKTWEGACSSIWTPNGRSSSNAEKAWTTIMLCLLVIGVSALIFSCFKSFIRSRKRQRNRQEYRQNRDEMMEIRQQNQRMLEEAGTPNAPDPFEMNLPSYEDAIRMPKPERPVKSMLDLTDSGRASRKLRRSRTNPEEDEPDDIGLLIDDRQRFRSEEMLSNRDKERTAQITPFPRTGYIAYNNSRCRLMSIDTDARFPAAHLKSQNLQSAEKIANFQGYEHSPYTKRRPKIADIPPFRRATMQADSVEFLTDPEYDAPSKPGSPFAKRKPKTPSTPSPTTSKPHGESRPLAPAVEDYFGAAQMSHQSSLADSDFQMVIEPDISSLPDGNNSTSSGEATSGAGVNLRRKVRKNSTSRRASGNFTAAAEAAAAGDTSSSSDKEPIVVVHKPMRETIF